MANITYQVWKNKILCEQEQCLTPIKTEGGKKSRKGRTSTVTLPKLSSGNKIQSSKRTCPKSSS